MHEHYDPCCGCEEIIKGERQTEGRLLLIHRRLRTRMRQDHRRVLPLPELLTDRWEKADYCGWGHGVSCYDSAIILMPVTVGEGTWIGPQVILDGSGGGIQIGSFCSISANVQVYTHDTVAWALSGGKLSRQEGAVKIGHSCYIGPNTVISRGVEIGHHCIIGANSLVKYKIPPLTFWAGTPARHLGNIALHEDGSHIIEYV